MPLLVETLLQAMHLPNGQAKQLFRLGLRELALRIALQQLESIQPSLAHFNPVLLLHAHK